MPTGGPRGNAIYRLIAGIIEFGLGLIAIPALVGLIGAVVFGVVDILMQLIRGNEGWSASGSSGLSGWAVRFYRYPIRHMNYIILGDPKDFPWLP